MINPTKQSLLDELKALQAKLEALADDDCLRCGDKYWTVEGTGLVIDPIWKNDFVDKGRFMQGRIFNTEQEAEKHAAWERAHAKLKRLAKGNEFKDSIVSYVIARNCGKLGIYTHDYTRDIGQVYFKTAEDAESALKEMGDDINLLV